MKVQRIVSIIVVLFFLAIGAATSFHHHSAVREQRFIVEDVQKLRHRHDAIRTKVMELEKRLEELDKTIAEREGVTND
jgi:uncharacterized protein YxeA